MVQQKPTKGIEQAAENLGLQINEAKTKLMVATAAGLPINNQNLRRRDLQIGERTFEVVPQLTYLGSKVSNDNSMEAELRARMLAANRSFYSLKNQFTSKNLSQRTKLGLHSTYIVPNDELYEMYGDLTGVQRIKLARLR